MSRLELLHRVAAGELAPEEVALALRADGIAELAGRARLDLDRADRLGVPEVVLAATKHPAELSAIVDTLLDRGAACCVSRMRPRQRRVVEAAARRHGCILLEYGRRSARLVAASAAGPPPAGLVGLLAAGTGDLEALEEARMVCEAAGVATRTAVDVGVAGLRRLFGPLAALVGDDADALVVAAGMDGALPSVVAGLAGIPVVGLPTSTGYGVGRRGRAALGAMLQSCAPGLVVVNIDNGVGAGAAAATIALRRLPARSRPPGGASGAPPG